MDGVEGGSDEGDAAGGGSDEGDAAEGGSDEGDAAEGSSAIPSKSIATPGETMDERARRRTLMGAVTDTAPVWGVAINEVVAALAAAAASLAGAAAAVVPASVSAPPCPRGAEGAASGAADAASGAADPSSSLVGGGCNGDISAGSCGGAGSCSGAFNGDDGDDSSVDCRARNGATGRGVVG